MDLGPIYNSAEGRTAVLSQANRLNHGCNWKQLYRTSCPLRFRSSPPAMLHWVAQEEKQQHSLRNEEHSEGRREAVFLFRVGAGGP